MDPHGQNDGPQPLAERAISVSAEFEGDEGIAAARALARSFLADLRTRHGMTVSASAEGMVQLVVSELVTNARKYAPGPCLLSLEIRDGAVQVSVWDSEPSLPVARTTDPGRVGQHGLEIVVAVCRSFEMHREPVGKRITATVMPADDAVGDEGSDDIRR
ncbi:Anti-sigma regulatory factor (Ser/Thr protein kinase) [Streptomyces misionensis]|uniref:Anti-sigma regulatory factor (Ser/Thr protein kinase) n=1 Tax=Streptomyces misionensis TaxID=67331 RepID=A0A1H4M1J7_9ACTN|nr:ATP-binding protein [Streptomyces misionensis]SEB76921.1 Anti-sigma regulatory factor (Ser/Thr protein kinase) [Streptomyces misionensis]